MPELEEVDESEILAHQQMTSATSTNQQSATSTNQQQKLEVDEGQRFLGINTIEEVPV